MSLQNLIECEDHWVTQMGKIFPEEKAILRGKDLHKELGHLSWFEVFLYGITGRFFTENQNKVLNFLWSCTGYPDPRIWNNRVSGLAGSTKSTYGLGVGAAVSVSEAEIYGPRTAIKCLDFFLRMSKAISSGCSLLQYVEYELSTSRKIYGYGRALVKGDERIPYLLDLVKSTNTDNGLLFPMAFEVEKILKAKKGLSMNVGVLYSVLAGDFGFTPTQLHAFLTPMFIAGMVPCYAEASEKSPGSLFPIRCSNLVYTGKSSRRQLIKNESDFRQKESKRVEIYTHLE